MSRNNSFACTGCGLCCRNVGQTIEAVKKMDGSIPFVKAFQFFTYKADASGACEKLDKDGKCTVYDNRPLVCNVEKMFEKFHKKKTTRMRHYYEQAQICNVSIRNNDLPDKFLVNEDQYRTS